MRKAAVFMIAVIVLLMAADNALACSCSFGSPLRAFDSAQAVFTGKVIKSKKSEWAVVVDKVWKGEVGGLVTLRDAHAGTSCAGGFMKGASYLFLVDVVESGGKTIYHPQVCTWTTRLKSAKFKSGENDYAWVEDLVLKDRGEGKPPMKKDR